MLVPHIAHMSHATTHLSRHLDPRFAHIHMVLKKVQDSKWLNISLAILCVEVMGSRLAAARCGDSAGGRERTAALLCRVYGIGKGERAPWRAQRCTWRGMAMVRPQRKRQHCAHMCSLYSQPPLPVYPASDTCKVAGRTVSITTSSLEAPVPSAQVH